MSNWRNLTVGGKAWRYCVGKGGGIVARHGEERRFIQAWDIKGMTPDNYDKGQWKKTNDGMVLPSEVAAWLESTQEGN